MQLLICSFWKARSNPMTVPLEMLTMMATMSMPESRTPSKILMLWLKDGREILNPCPKLLLTWRKPEHRRSYQTWPCKSFFVKDQVLYHIQWCPMETAKQMQEHRQEIIQEDLLWGLLPLIIIKTVTTHSHRMPTKSIPSTTIFRQLMPKVLIQQPRAPWPEIFPSLSTGRAWTPAPNLGWPIKPHTWVQKASKSQD